MFWLLQERLGFLFYSSALCSVVSLFPRGRCADDGMVEKERGVDLEEL